MRNCSVWPDYSLALRTLPLPSINMWLSVYYEGDQCFAVQYSTLTW